MRILVVEDEFLAALLLEEDLRAAGFSVVGPFNTVTQAAERARNEKLDVAILDVNLHGEMVVPLAEELAERGVPFLFLSGYATRNLPEEFRGFPRLAKPYDPALLVREIQRLASRPG
jgi:DNA-binding response OmpR family regulator